MTALSKGRAHDDQSASSAGTGAIRRLVETMHVRPGRQIPLLPGHLARLNRSCLALGWPWPEASLHRSMDEALRGLPATGHFRLRLLLDGSARPDVETSALPDLPEGPLRLRLSRHPLEAGAAVLCHKAAAPEWYGPARTWLANNPAVFDVAFCNPRGELCEGSRSNVYVWDESEGWLTPALSCGLLPGVQRQALLDAGLVREAVLTGDSLVDARRIRVSNALRGWRDAVLDDAPWGT